MYLENGNETPRESYSVLLCLKGSPLVLWQVYKALHREGHHHVSYKPKIQMSVLNLRPETQETCILVLGLPLVLNPLLAPLGQAASCSVYFWISCSQIWRIIRI